MLLSGDQSINDELMETEGNSIDDSSRRFVSQAAQVFASDLGTGTINVFIETISESSVVL